MITKKGITSLPKGPLIAVAAVTGLIILFLLFINALLAPIVRHKIENAVIKGSDSLYRVSFSKLEINIFTGEAELTDIQLTPNAAGRRVPAQLYRAQVKQLLVTQARPFKYWFTKKLEVGQITMTSPVLSVFVLKKVSSPDKKQTTVYQKLSGEFKSIHVAGISLTHANLKYTDQTGAAPVKNQLRDLTIAATDLLIDSATQKDTSRTLYCRDIAAGLRNFQGASPDGNYHYGVRSVNYSARTGRLTARGMALRPLPVSQFFARTKDDRFTFELDMMIIDHLSYGSFMLDDFLDASKLVAAGGSLGIYSNPNGPLAKTDRIITFPHYIIRTLKTHFAIDTLAISRFNVSYTEFNKKPAKAGTLIFKDIKAQFLHISNQGNKLAENPLCRAQVAAMFMGRGKLELSAAFNLTDKIYAFQYAGHLGGMNLTDINPLVMPLALGKVNSGQLESLDFDIAGNRKTNTGTLKLLYKNLHIELLDRNYILKPVKTLLANTLVVKQSNPDSGSSSPRFAKVVFLRPKNYPFFRTLWATLLSGIRPCAGMGYAVKPGPPKPLSAKEQKARDKALKKALKEKKKADKQYKKQLRKQAEKKNPA